MIIDEIKTALTAAGCTLVLYESEAMTNTQTDQSKPEDILGVVKEPDIITLKVVGNGITRDYSSTIVEILAQAKPEDLAENNEATLEALLVVCGAFITQLISGKAFQKIKTAQAVKITERKYDANLIGWSLLLDLQPIENKLNC